MEIKNNFKNEKNNTTSDTTKDNIFHFSMYIKPLIIIFVLLIGYKAPIIDRLFEHYEILFQSFLNSLKKNNIKKYHLNKDPNFEYFYCFCAMGRKENLYLRELINYYINLGVEKFVFGDNNSPDTEKMSDVLQDYINNGTVDIIDIIGNRIGQGEFYGIMYQKYKNRCKWLSFFDFDEYLVMNFEVGKHISVQEYLSNKIFDKCDVVLINWLMYGDNDYVYYNKNPLKDRFTKPDFFNYANKFVKSIVRGNINKKVFGYRSSCHMPNDNLRLCNSIGEKANYIVDIVYPPVLDYAYLAHFNTKTSEEFVEKTNRGLPGKINHPRNIRDSIRLFFNHNKFSRKKMEMFSKKFNLSYDKKEIFNKYKLFK